MISDEEQYDRELTASLVQWAVDQPQPGTLVDDALLAPEGARSAIAEMERHYDGLREWVTAASLAARTRAAEVVAQANGAPKVILNQLHADTDAAEKAFNAAEVEKTDDLIKLGTAYAALQRIAAQPTKPTSSA